MDGRCVKEKKSFCEYSKIGTGIREKPIKLAQYLRGEKELEPIRRDVADISCNLYEVSKCITQLESLWNS